MSVTLHRRGGGRALADLNVSSLTWRRVRNESSDATVTVAAATVTTGAERALGLLRPGRWDLELAVWDTDADEVAWVGPVHTPTWGTKEVTLAAKDLAAWFDHRLLPFNREYRDVDLGFIAAGHAADALRTDPSPLIDVAPMPVGIVGDRDIAAAQNSYAGDALRELVRDGVDMTMAARTLLLSSERVAAPMLPPLIDDMVEDPALTAPGLAAATEGLVRGAAVSAVSRISGLARLSDHLDGLLQKVRDEPAIRAAASAREAAVEELAASAHSQVLTGTLARRWAPLRDLVPGRVTRVALTLAGGREVTGLWRLTSLTVTDAADLRLEAAFVPVHRPGLYQTTATEGS